MKKVILVLVVLGLILIPSVVDADTLKPTCHPPEEWYAEYCEWLAWQQQLQQDYANETGYGLGMLLTFSQWAEYREVNHSYWWKSARQTHSYLFCDSNGEQVAKSWEWSKT